MGGYAGSVPSHIACGPDVRVRYAGGGGVASTHFNGALDAHPGTGVMVGAGGAAEYLDTALLRCSDSGNCTLPPSGGYGAGTARIGYDWNRFGFRVGGLVYFGADGAFVLPDVAVRFGQMGKLRFSCGVGSYDVPSMLRPGVWAGWDGTLEGGWELGLHGGAHLGADSVSSLRIQSSLGIPLGEQLRLNLAPAVWLNELGTGPEMTIGLSGRL